MNKALWHEHLVYGLNRPIPYMILEAARQLGDVVDVPGVGHVISDAEIARVVLTDNKCFDSHSPGSLGVLIDQILGPCALLNMDGDEHKHLKRTLLEVFSPRYVNTIIDATTADYVQRFRAELATGATVDVVSLMRNVASRMACELIGVRVDPDRAEATYATMFNLATEFTALAGLGKRQLSARDVRRGKIIAQQLATHIGASYRDRELRDHSLTQALREQGYHFDDIKGTVIIVMIGATELITYGMPRVLSLLIDSGQLGRLRRHPDLIDRAIDEGFRLVTPSNVILRAVVRDCEIGGHRFLAGRRALVVFHNIMRQERRFPDATRFDIERTIDPRYRRLPFGAGPHTCLGTALALAEARMVLETVCKLDGELCITRRRYNHGKTYPGYSQLWVKLADSRA